MPFVLIYLLLYLYTILPLEKKSNLGLIDRLTDQLEKNVNDTLLTRTNKPLGI